jgi:hypothetical protein
LFGLSGFFGVRHETNETNQTNETNKINQIHEKSGLEANAVGSCGWWLHQLADGFEEGSNVAIM